MDNNGNHFYSNPALEGNFQQNVAPMANNYASFSPFPYNVYAPTGMPFYQGQMNGYPPEYYQQLHQQPFPQTISVSPDIVMANSNPNVSANIPQAENQVVVKRNENTPPDSVAQNNNPVYCQSESTNVQDNTPEFNPEKISSPTQNNKLDAALTEHFFKKVNQKINERLKIIPKADLEEGFLPVGNSMDYSQNEDGIYCRDANDNRVKLTDFCFEKIFKVKHHHRSGKPTEYYVLRLINNTGRTQEIVLKSTKWSDLPKEIEKQAPTFQIFEDTCPGAKQKFLRASKEFLKEQTETEHVTVIDKHHYWGWGLNIQNHREFYDGLRSDCVSEKKLLPVGNHNDVWQKAMKLGLKIFEIGSNAITYPTVIYSLASYADALFTDAGYPLEHCLMILGASGSKKTSLMKVIFNPFVPENEKVHTIRSTSAAMNILHQDCYDDTLVIDDLNFEGTSAEIEAKKKNFRDLIRIYSDKTPRAKYGGEDKVKKNLVRGGCVFTAESNLTGQIASSELRYIKVYVDQSVDGSKLQEFQSKPFIWKQVVSEWIGCLANNYGNFVEHIKQEFPKRRMNAKIQEPRLVDAFIHLQLTAELFTWYMLNLGLMSEAERNQFCVNFCEILAELIAKQSIDATNQIAHIMYISELWNLLGTDEVKIAPSLDKYIAHMQRYVGYKEDNGIIMLKRDKAYEAVVRAFAARNEFFPYSADEISKLLKDHGLTISEKNETLKRASARLAGRPRMLAIIENKCQQVVDSIKI